MVSLNELLSKLKDSVFPSALPAVCSSVHKLVSSLCSISNRQHSPQHVLADTDSDEDHCSSIQPRCKFTGHKRISEKEMELFFKYFPCLTVPKIGPQVNAPVIVDNLNLQLLEYFDEVDQSFSLPEVTCEQIIWQSTHCVNDQDKHIESDDNHIVDLFSLIEGTIFC